MFKMMAGYLLFLLLYYLPFALDPDHLVPNQARIRELMGELLSNTTIQCDLALQIGVHFALVTLVFIPTAILSRHFSRAVRVRYSVSLMAHLLACLAVLNVINAKLFEESDYAITFDAANNLLTASLSGIFLAASLAVTARTRPIVVICILAAIVIALVDVEKSPAPNMGDISAGRNIIIIGIDSLSRPMLDETLPHLPALAELENSAYRFTNAYTTLGRTFPAWVSILTGDSPAKHGAVFNLRAIESVDRTQMLTWDLKRQGYQTIYAIDERRFSNLDNTFGFDHIVGPRAGALDFAVQAPNDTPLTNLLLQTRLAKYLLPYSHTNTAAYASYSAALFNHDIQRVLDVDRPIFLAVHFESAHFPYKSRHGQQTFRDGNNLENNHKSALTGIDLQIGRLIKDLTLAGKMRNALVIILSDHGESFGRPYTVHNGSLTSSPNAYGHGTDLADEAQNNIIISLIEYRDGDLVTRPEKDNKFISLLSVKEIINRYLEGLRPEAVSPSQCFPVETGIRLISTHNLDTLNQAEVVDEAAGFYEIDGVGRMALLERKIPELVRLKDVGVRCDEHLVFYSAANDHTYTYAKINSEWHNTDSPPLHALEQLMQYRQQLSKIGIVE